MNKVKIANMLLDLSTKARLFGLYLVATFASKDMEWVKEKRKIILFQAKALQFDANPTPRKTAIVSNALWFEQILNIDAGTSIFTRNYKLLACGLSAEEVDHAIILMPLFSSLKITNGNVLDLFLEMTNIRMETFNNFAAYDWGEYAKWRDAAVEAGVPSPFWKIRVKAQL